MMVPSAFFAAFLVTAGAAQAFQANGQKLPAGLLAIIFVATILTVFGVIILFAFKFHMWELDSGVLYRGFFRGLALNLGEIETIRVGMPPR